MIEKILIANRGEIAVRVIRACREMGIRTVAVYSEADKDALHTQLADEAVCIGPAPSAESYLNMQNIISATLVSGADAIHPGFGFLSENSKFAELCEQCKITYIGPDSKVISALGNKSVARNTMVEAGVPVIPGSKEPVTKIRDCNSLYIEQGDDFCQPYVKGIFVDIFPFVDYPDIPRSWIKTLTKGISKSYSILNHRHTYSLRSFAEFFYFGGKYCVCSALWKIVGLFGKKTRYSDVPFLNGRGISFDKKAVKPLGTIKFEGKEFPAPCNPDSYLTDLYGDYMKIPPVEKREFHSIFILPELRKRS